MLCTNALCIHHGDLHVRTMMLHTCEMISTVDGQSFSHVACVITVHMRPCIPVQVTVYVSAWKVNSPYHAKLQDLTLSSPPSLSHGVQYRLVVKGSLELLVVFANFSEKQSATTPSSGERISPTSGVSRTSRVIIEAVKLDDAGRG